MYLNVLSVSQLTYVTHVKKIKADSDRRKTLRDRVGSTVFRMLLVLFGIEEDSPWSCGLWLRQSLLVVSLFFYSYNFLRQLYPLFLVLFGRSSDFVSCADLANGINMLFFVIAATQVVWLMLVRRNQLRQLLHDDLDDKGLLCWMLLCWIPATTGLAILVFLKQRQLEDALLILFGLPIWFGSLFFLLLYLYFLSVVCQRQKKILEQLSSDKCKLAPLSSVIAEKWALRDTTAQINNVCGCIMTVFYVKFFMAFVYSAANVFCSSMTDVKVHATMLTHSSYLAHMVMIAVGGSKLASLCSQAEKILQCQSSARDDAETEELRDVLRYRKRWDALSLTGGYAVTASTLVSFITTCVTLVAIILQFDFRVINKLNEAVEFLKNGTDH